MPDLGAYDEPVEFDWDAATRLAAELRATATLLESQIGPRGTFAANARKDWEGKYAVAFDGRMKICIDDGKEFVKALRDTALKVDELAKLARAEQRRRDLAKEWKRKHDEWQRKRDSRSTLEQIGGAAVEVIGLADRDEPEPPEPPQEPTRYTADPPTTAKRD